MCLVYPMLFSLTFICHVSCVSNVVFSNVYLIKLLLFAANTNLDISIFNLIT